MCFCSLQNPSCKRDDDHNEINQFVNFLECHIAKMEDTGLNRRKLVDSCRTRWVAQIKAFEAFDSLFPVFVNTLEEVSRGIRNGWNKDLAVQAE